MKKPWSSFPSLQGPGQWLKPAAGFSWRYEGRLWPDLPLANVQNGWPRPPVEIEPLRRVGDETYLGPWLLPADLSTSSMTFTPPRTRRVLDEFLDLGRHPQLLRREREPDPGPADIYFREGGMTDWLGAVRDFANRFGWLGSWPVQILISAEPPDPLMKVLDEDGRPRYQRIAEFRREWEGRVREVRDLWRLWDAARRAQKNELRAYDELNEHIEWANRDSVPFISRDPEEEHVMLKEDLLRVVYSEADQEPESQWRLGACRIRYGRKRIYLQGWRDSGRSTIRPTKATLTTAAHLALSSAIAHETRGMVTMLPSIERRELRQVPDHLLGTIYLLLAQEVVGAAPRLRWRACQHCGTMMVAGRRDKRFCSDACRYAGNYVARVLTAN